MLFLMWKIWEIHKFEEARTKFSEGIVESNEELA